MKSLFKALSNLFRTRPRLGHDELQAAFRAHYRNFRSLLTANNNALEIMAEMEAELHSGKAFGMAFVRGQCTGLGVNVYKMVQNLIQLSDGRRYKGLNERFRIVTGQIETILSRQPEVTGTSFVLSMDEIDRRTVDQVGGKMANLGEIRNRIGLRVPDGFAISAAASKHFMETTHLQDEINRRLKLLDIDDLENLYRTSEGVQNLIASAPLPEDLESLIQDQYRRLSERAGLEPPVSMRSSALGEDSLHVSFAGQYLTRLNVQPQQLLATYREIVAGKYQSQAIVYRQQRGYRHQDVLMGVGCLTMVDAAVSGVSYSRPPDNPRSTWILIHAAPGLGSQVVDGSTPYDLFRVSREPPHDVVNRRLGPARSDGIACLTDDQIRELANLSIQIEEHFGSPQDIEWAIDRNGKTFILQARPLGSSMPPPGDVDRLEDSPDLPVPMLSGGVTASRGAASGKVFKVRSGMDLLEFPDGAVLVVETPHPEWAVLMNRTAAVLSASGQAATHLATVAREFGVPALFDLAGIFELLENGQTVTVDATGRRVYENRIEPLLAETQPKPNLMEGSPIHRLLKETLTLITPLHLTTPDSPFFKATSCKTLHDITRFCHEKAVTEMFNFGTRYGFNDRAAKQLVVVGMASQWWVINLDDGFREGVVLNKPFVGIDDIVSEPMLAIWRGMNAVPWDGPPPVSLRGLGSIIAQSTMNPQLDPAVRSNMAGKNYFLVSRNFCNLCVRLGYHFAMAEASFSDLLTESYVNFQFKGGAADERRRRRRVRLLAETLREMDFRVDQKGDALTARIEKRPVPFLKERLMVLGYLLIHTRQVDMVMEEEAFIDRFLEKIHADIKMIREQFVAEGQVS